MSDYYNVYLSVSQYGDKYRAELFTEDLGSTDGELLPIEWQGVDEWYPFLTQGAAGMPATSAEQLGQKLFQHLLGNPANHPKWAEVVRQALAKGRGVRLLVDSSIPDEATERANDKIHNLPYGLLRDQDGGYYLFRPRAANQDRPDIQFVRVLRRSTPRPLRLVRRPLHVLLAAAEPGEQPFHFGCAGVLAELARALDGARTPEGQRAFEASVCTADGVQPLGQVLEALAAGPPGEDFHKRFCRTTRDGLRAALRDADADIFHLLAHGFGTGVVLCGPQAIRADVASEELAEWCGANARLEFAFLQACWAAQTQGRGSLGGVAQRLLNPKGGNLAAVIASSYPLDAEQSTRAAVAFYTRLAEKGASELALDRSLDLANWSWALLELWVRLSPLGTPRGRADIQYLSPYRGLGYFQERDAHLFFGRDAEVADLLHVLATEQVVAVVGDTGSGKSSLLRAGLTYQVRGQGLAGRGGWQVVVVRPGDHPARSLLEALPPDPQAPAPAGDPGLLERLRDRLDRACRPDRPLLVLCDQFEEMFTLCRDEAERLATAHALLEFAQHHPDDFRVVLALRSDYLGAAAALSAALPAGIDLPKRPWLLGPPGPDALRAIVVKPAEYFGYEFEGPQDDGDPRHRESLLDRIFGEPLLSPRPATGPDAAGAATPLPLLEFALQQLWLEAVGRDRDSQRFTHADYDRLGGLSGAVTKHAERVYQDLLVTPGLGARPKALVEKVLTGVVSGQGTRQPRARDELEAETGSPDAARVVIDRLIEERLFTVRRNPDHPEDRAQALVEFPHEVLLTRWERLKALLTENPRERELRQRFQAAAEKWDKGLLPDMPPRAWALLPSYHESVRLLGWLDLAKLPVLTATQSAFAEALRGKVRRRQWAVIVAIAGSLVVAAAMLGLALLAWGEGRLVEQQLYATEVRLTQEAWEGGDYERARKVLQGWERRDWARRLRGFEWDYLSGLMQRSWPPGSGGGPTGDPGGARLKTLAFTPGGERLVSGAADGTVALWGVPDLKPDRALRGPPGEVLAVAFAPGGKALAVRSREGTDTETTAGHVKLWDAVTWEELPPLKGAPQVVTSMAFSPDGKRFAVAGWGKNPAGEVKSYVLFWHVPAWGEGVRVREGPPTAFSAVVFGPDSNTLAAGGWRAEEPDSPPVGELKLWDLGTGEERKTLSGEVDEFNALLSSPDGKTLATVALTTTVNLWEWGDGAWRKEKSLVHPDFVYCLALAPDGRTLATGGRDRTVRLWDTATARERATLKGHGAEVVDVAFSPDGRILASDDGAGKVRFWDPVPGERDLLRVSPYPVLAAAFAPSGTALVLASGVRGKDEMAAAPPGGVALWSPAGGQLQPLAPARGLGSFRCAAFSPDGATLAWAGAGGAVTLWDVPNGRETASLPGHVGRVHAVAFSPDGRLLASGGEDGTVRLWDVAGRKEVGPPAGASAPGGPCGAGHAGPVHAVAFSPDGRLLASGGEDGTVRLWDMAGWREKYCLKGHRGPVYAVAFSPQGNLLASGGDDPLVPWGKEGQTVRLWDGNTGKERGLPKWHGGTAWAVGFSADGRRLASASENGTVKLWDVDTGLQLIVLNNQVPVYAVAFSRDGQTLATGDVEGVARLWRAPRPK